jgi:UDP-N-acetyl-2-amino-2-deoxyglucuronate dehydrogenase
MLKIGVLGCGRISGQHFEAIAAQTNAECAACCDIVGERAKQAASIYNVPFWTDRYEDMLAIDEIELIAVCTPSGLHPLHGIMAAGKGKHVLTEKPVGVRVLEADALIKACEDNRVKLYVMFQNRFNPAVQLLRRAFEEGRFGRIYMIIANVFWTRSQEYYDMASWRGTWALDGGAFLNQASHYVDMVQWFGGPVKKIHAVTATLARTREAEDTGSAIFHFKNGAVGCINVTVLTYPQNLEGSITIIGQTGTARVAGVAMNRIEYWNFADKRKYDSIIEVQSAHDTSIYGKGHTYYYSLIIDKLSSIASSPQQLNWPVDGYEGKKSLELIEEIYRSSRRGRD